MEAPNRYRAPLSSAHLRCSVHRRRSLRVRKPNAPSLTQLRGFGGGEGLKYLKNQPVGLKGLHYRTVAEVAWVVLILGGDCTGSSSLNLSRSNWSSGSGWV